MKWSKRSQNSIQSGEYVISRATVQGKNLFTLWQGTQPVGHADTAAMAKQMADDTAAKERKS